jgi:Nucleotidyl transferase AbiEii toxin, Type IV TA system
MSFSRFMRSRASSTGVRISLTCHLSRARIPFHVDINVGDPIWPRPTLVEVPRLLSGSIAVLGYPLPMMFAEKIVTAVQRGTVNTRWRD